MLQVMSEEEKKENKWNRFNFSEWLLLATDELKSSCHLKKKKRKKKRKNLRVKKVNDFFFFFLRFCSFGERKVIYFNFKWYHLTLVLSCDLSSNPSVRKGTTSLCTHIYEEVKRVRRTHTCRTSCVCVCVYVVSIKRTQKFTLESTLVLENGKFFLPVKC